MARRTGVGFSGGRDVNGDNNVKAIRQDFWVGLALITGFVIVSLLPVDAFAQQDVMGKRVPNFALNDVAGRTFSMKELKGKVIVLDFWAVWCGPCQNSMPFFQEIQNEYGKYGLEVIGVHVDDRMPMIDTIRKFLDERGIRYRNLVSTREVDDKFMIYAMPTTYLVNREGVVAKRHVGYNSVKTPSLIEGDVREVLGLD